LGVNSISRQLVASLAASNTKNVQVVDFPLLRNLRLFGEDDEVDLQQWPVLHNRPVAYKAWMDQLDNESLHCVVATTDFGNHRILNEWNRFCLDRKWHFLPVVLQHVVGYIGPLVIPGETACFECLRSRQDAHLEDAQLGRAVEAVAFEGQEVVGFHPTMSSILGDIAAFELTKFYSGVLPGGHVGSLIEVNLLATYLTSRKVLKVPRCPACSPFNQKPAALAYTQTIRLFGEKGS
jgi:thiazole/oxazole-forming peptide maturase SagC family component